MFNFFKSEHAKLRETAKNWLYLASKVYHFRKDLLSDSELAKLVQLSEEVKVGIKSRKDNGERLRSSVEGLKKHMQQVGANYYPRSSMAENVEFFFAAIIIYIGFTSLSTEKSASTLKLVVSFPTFKVNRLPGVGITK